MRQGEKFSDEQVRAIKLALIGGTPSVAIARLEGVSETTIMRIRTGRSYNHVKVEGEELLRPPIVTNGYRPERVDTMGQVHIVMPEPSAAEVEASRQRLERMLATPETGITPEEALADFMGQGPSPQE